MASEIKWIKITTDMFEDEKIDFITSLPESDAIIVIWIRLLALAGKCNAGGYVFLTEKIPYTEEMLSNKFKKPLNIVRLAFETFKRLDMIVMDERGIYFPKWEKYQNVEGMERQRQLTNDRVKRHRKKQNELPPSNANVTLQSVIVTHLEREEELDKELDKEKDINNTLSLGNNPHQKRLLELFNEYRLEGGAYALDIVYSYIGQVELELIELAIKKSEGKHINYFKRIINDWIKDGGPREIPKRNSGHGESQSEGAAAQGPLTRAAIARLERDRDKLAQYADHSDLPF